MWEMEDLILWTALGPPIRGGVGEGVGVACLDPTGLKPLPRKGLTLPVGELLRELVTLWGSAIIANAWFFRRRARGVSLKIINTRKVVQRIIRFLCRSYDKLRRIMPTVKF